MKLPPLLSLGLTLHLAGGAFAVGSEPLVVPLWPGDAPGSAGQTAAETVRVTAEGEHIVASVHRPSLTVYLPPAETNTGAAVVILPGGGHRELWMDHEGYNVARWLANHGIAGVILKYRLAGEQGSPYKVGVHALADAQRAVQFVRSRAEEWRIDPERVGIVGFSAGGELAALAAMRPLAADPTNADVVRRHSSKPAFQALVYPGGCDRIQPDEDTPPAFLLCGYDDNLGMATGVAEVYLRFKRAGVPAELHIYTGSGHGFGIREGNQKPSRTWPERFREWLEERGFLSGRSRP